MCTTGTVATCGCSGIWTCTSGSSGGSNGSGGSIGNHTSAEPQPGDPTQADDLTTGSGTAGAVAYPGGPVSVPADGFSYKNSAQASISVGRDALSLGDYQRAIDAASRSIAQFPNNPAAYELRAQAYNRLRDYASAERDAKAAIDLQPTSAAFETLAFAQLRQRKFQDALKSADEAVRLKPDSALAHAIRAYIEEALGNREALLADIRRAAELDQAFDAKRRLAEAGQLIDDPNSDDPTLLVGRGSGLEAPSTGEGVPWDRAIEVFLFLAAVLASTWFVLDRRRKTGSWKAALTPVRLPPVTVETPSTGGQPGDWVGKYELGNIIGRGGMGVVYEAKDHSLGRSVAIKKMSDTCIGMGENQRQKFIREARTVASLHHDGIVDIYDIIEQDDNVYLVFEFVSGKTAHELLSAEGRMPLWKVVSILRPVCEALEYAHGKGFVHRDLKPMNIMVTEENRAKLMDFGIARLVTGSDGKPDQARTQTVLGTPVYMAPECWTGIVRKESDIYSLGVTLYELLTGSLPYKNPITDAVSGRYEVPSVRVAGLPAAVDELIARSLDPDPNKRIASAKEFLQRLESAGRPALGTPAG